MDDAAIAAAMTEIDTMLQGDGAALLLVSADPKTARIEVRLDFEHVECEECVVPPDLLRDLIEATFRRQLREEFELVLEDPRRPAG